MSNATRWYATREACKAAVGINGASLDAQIDAKIESASEGIERLLGRRFIPYTATKQYRFPSRRNRNSYVLQLDEDLIAVTSLTKATDTATAIASTDYFLEPVNSGPPYDCIEIDLSTSEYFTNEDTPQRAVRVTGRWGYGEDTKAAGALAEADDGSETALEVTDASLIGVGDTILIGTEAMFVSGRATLTTGTTLNDTLTASESDVTVTLASGAAAKQGEVLLLDSEKMLVESISGNDLTVKRAYDGSVLAAHSTGITVYAYRLLTVVRAVNGTTAAIHSTAAAIVKYAPPAAITELVIAEAIAHMKQDQSGWTGQISGGEGAVRVSMGDLASLQERVRWQYRRLVFA